MTKFRMPCAFVFAIFGIALSHPSHAQSNRAPTISGIPATSVVARETYNFVPVASDPDGNKLTFSISNQPAWAVFSTKTGRLTAAPGISRLGTTSNIVISVSDGRLSSSLPPFSITVLATSSNLPPVLSGSPAQNATAGSSYSFTPSGSDPEGRALIWSIANRPAWATFNTSTGRLSGTPASGNIGTTSGIVISASDGSLQTSLPPFSLTVASSGGSGGGSNRPPVISGTPATTVVARTTYHFLPVASDPDGDKLTFSISNQPAWAVFSTKTGRLTATPGISRVGTTSNIVISVSDGRQRVSLPPFSVTVMSSGSTTNRPPGISGSPSRTGTVGLPYAFAPVASDPDGDSLTWSISGKPSAAAFSLSTGRLDWTPTSAGTTPNIIITVTDSRGASASLPAFTIAVAAAPTTTGNAALTWQAPTQYTNGSSLPASSVGAYRIYRGSSPTALSRIAEVDGRTTSFTVQGLARGTHYFAVTAVTTSGTESALSAVGSKTIQ